MDIHEIHELSKSMRETSKANCIVVRSEMRVLEEVVREQEKARGTYLLRLLRSSPGPDSESHSPPSCPFTATLGNFPGPCPVVFCPAEDAEEDLTSLTKIVAEAGATCMMLQMYRFFDSTFHCS